MLTPIQRIEIVKTVKEALNRRVTVEDVTHVEMGDYCISHPVSALIKAEIDRINAEFVKTDHVAPRVSLEACRLVILESMAEQAVNCSVSVCALRGDNVLVVTLE